MPIKNRIANFITKDAVMVVLVSDPCIVSKNKNICFQPMLMTNDALLINKNLIHLKFPRKIKTAHHEWTGLSFSQEF